MEDLVSVIIPTYKRSDKIERAIKSVINQTYKNIEIIVVDDNANNPDEREKTENIVKKYKRVKLIKNEKNFGGALTRNIGIENSIGNYIAFLDDDDEFIHNKIEKQMDLLKEKERENRKVGLIYCYKNIMDINGNLKYEGRKDEEGNCLYEHMIECIETTSTWLCPKKVLEQVGMFENVKAHQDNILLLKILANGYEIYRVPEVLVKFYLHNGQGITNKNANYIEYTKTLINFKRKYYYLLNQKQIDKVEYQNSKMLMELYINNKKKKDYLKELRENIKKYGLNKETLKDVIRYFYFYPVTNRILKFYKGKKDRKWKEKEIQ